MSPDPAALFEHAESFCDPIAGIHGSRQRDQGECQRSGLLPKAADPVLAALVRHARLTGCAGGGCHGRTVAEARNQKQRNHQDTETEIR